MKLLRYLKWLLLPAVIALVLYFVVLKPQPVASLSFSRGAVLVEAFGTGSVESRRTISVGFEVTGRVERLEADQGDVIRRGQELAAIDDETFQVDVELAREEITLAESSLVRLKTEIDRAEAVLAGAASNLARIRPLVESRVASAEELDVAVERHKVGLAELASAQAADEEGKRVLATAARKLQRAEVDLARTVVISPVDGVVLRREREVGDVAVPGASVLRIADTDTIWASVWVDETYLPALETGMPARIELRSNAGEILAGSVARIGREVDRETRELLVDVSFNTPPADLFFGQRVDLRIELSRRDEADRIPRAALARVDGEEGVFVLAEGRAQFRKLSLGAHGREFVEVLEGLPSGAMLLSPRLANGKPVKEGQRVVTNEPEESGK